MKLHNHAAGRNRQPILELLQTWLPDSGRVLEVASGSGQHVELFAAHLPALHWQPSDVSAQARASVAARVADAGLSNVAAPIVLDALGDWPSGPFDALVAINLLHVSHWDVTDALFAGAANALSAHGRVFVYGPFNRDGTFTSQGNRDFDANLRARDAAWGLRDVEAVVACAATRGFDCERIVEMPANNLSLLLQRGQDTHP